METSKFNWVQSDLHNLKPNSFHYTNQFFSTNFAHFGPEFEFFCAETQKKKTFLCRLRFLARTDQRRCWFFSFFK